MLLAHHLSLSLYNLEMDQVRREVYTSSLAQAAQQAPHIKAWKMDHTHLILGTMLPHVAAAPI